MDEAEILSRYASNITTDQVMNEDRLNRILGHISQLLTANFAANVVAVKLPLLFGSGTKSLGELHNYRFGVGYLHSSKKAQLYDCDYRSDQDE